jgi:uncharacterized protein
MHPTPSSIIRRRVTIAFDPSKARGWHLKKKAIEDFLNAVSFTFPPGEKFFIQSVQNYRDRITDPDLKEQVKRFIYQEAMHTKEHVRCNIALLQAFPDGHKIEELAAKSLSLIRRITPKATQLAWTCALEHFTAILADTLLRGQEVFVNETDSAFAALWLWHAVEESEHKAVCFDVYQEVFGKGVFSYLHRAIVMFVASLTFIFTMFFAIRLIKKSGDGGKNNSAVEKPRDMISPWNSSSLPVLLRGMKEILPLKLYLDYYRPSFHPWDHDSIHLIEEWKRRYRDFGSPHATLSE